MRDRVDPALPEHLGDERIRREVALGRGARCADALHLRTCLGKRRTVGQQKLGAELRQRDGGRLPDAARRTGDKGAPAPEVSASGN